MPIAENLLDADDQISLDDDDSDFDDDLNLGELDNVLDQMSAITGFLRYSYNKHFILSDFSILLGFPQPWSIYW